MEIVELLPKISPLSKEDIALFKARLQLRSFHKGEIITKIGAVQEELYLVEEGVQMSYYYHNDKQHIMAFTYPPSATGVPDSFFDQQPSQFCLEAMTDSKLWAISYASLMTLFEQSRAIERLFRKMTEQVFIGLTQRIVELQSYSMEERFRVFAARSPHLFQLIPHKYLAAYVNISVTNFSKLYNRIKIGD